LPLSVRGIQLSVALERSGDCWVSASACRCGFVRMLGAFAGPESVLQVGDGQPLYIQPADGSAVDPAALRTALAGQAHDVPVRLQLGDEAALSDLDLWLTLTQTELARVTLLAAPGGWLPLAALLPFGGLVSDATEPARLGVAMLLPGEVIAGSLGGEHRAVVRGYGPGGPALAARLAGLAASWDELGRPGTMDLQLSVRAAGSGPPEAAGRAVLDRPNACIEVGWAWP
jgi:protein-L-isoaspartate(D-aspartate) O-methyltransferase